MQWESFLEILKTEELIMIGKINKVVIRIGKINQNELKKLNANK